MSELTSTSVDGRLRRLLDKAEDAFARLRGEDEEALHDLRVALRRLRATLASSDSDDFNKARKRLGAIARSTGALRDTEITLEWLRASLDRLGPAERPGGEWLIRHFERRLARRRAKLNRKLARRWPRAAAAVESGLQTAAGLAVNTADRETITRYTAALARRLDALRAAPDDVAAAHKARLAAKRLRYALEPWAGIIAEADGAVAALTKMQDDLGSLNDSVEILHALERAMRRAAMEHAEHLLAATLEAPGQNAGGAVHGLPDPLPGVLTLARLARDERQLRHRSAWRRHAGRGTHQALRLAARAADKLTPDREEAV